jgi:hypothetical protein
LSTCQFNFERPSDPSQKSINENEISVDITETQVEIPPVLTVTNNFKTLPDKPVPTEPQCNPRHSSTGERTTPRMNQAKMQDLYHFARVYRKLSLKGILNLTIQEICKLAFIHKMLNKYVSRRRTNEFLLGSCDFEVVGESEQGCWAHMTGYIYDSWMSLFGNENFGAVYYRDWKYITIKLGR